MKQPAAILSMLLVTLGAGAFATRIPSAESDQQVLSFLWEEEKLARDLYSAFVEKWSLRPFVNIARAEQQHMGLVAALMKKKGMKVPKEEKPGRFKNQEIQRLYNQWQTPGLLSSINALRIGATVEDRDIFDLDRIHKESQDTDIKNLCQTLRAGSAQHMRAFTRNLSNRGETYRPQFISQATLHAILGGR